MVLISSFYWQLLTSGTLDIDYLGKMLEFALATLRKLSAPANDRENETTHQNLLEELHSLCQAKDESGDLRSVAIVKGIRFILEQIQVCISSSARSFLFCVLPVHLSVPSFLFFLYLHFPTGT